MSEKKRPRIEIVSSRDLTVEAGGGMQGWVGVAIREPQNDEFRRVHHRLSLYPNPNSPYDIFGVCFLYETVHSVRVGGEVVWQNWDEMSRSRRGVRQDVERTGIVSTKIYTGPKIMSFLKEHREALEKLGLTLPEIPSA